MNIYIEFGRRLAFIRQNSKLSQSQIAQKLNIAQSTYAGYEKGVRKIPLEIIVQLSKILNISEDTAAKRYERAKTMVKKFIGDDIYE